MVLKTVLVEMGRFENATKTQCIKKGVDILRQVSSFRLMRFARCHVLTMFAFTLFGSATIRAENIAVGTLIDDAGYFFSSFGNQYTLGTTRGANFGGSGSVTWYGVNMSNVSGQNGITWSGVVASHNNYNYNSIYSGNPGTGAAANDLTNSGISGNNTTISITANAGQRYVVDLLFANHFSGVGADYSPYRTLDVSVGGLLYADNLTLNGTESDQRRPLLYRFEVTPSSSSINIVLTNGGNVPGSRTDTNPYVNAMIVTQVPEPSALSLLAVGLGGLAMMRRRRG